MKVNLFGSACSATIAQFALRKNAKDHGQAYGPQVHDAINGCYVDDVPMTAPTEDEFVKTVKGVVSCARAAALRW